MTKLLITYDTADVDGTRGEACCEVEVSDTVANVLLTLDLDHIDPLQSWMIVALGGVLMNLEMLKCRRYVVGSIKDIRPSVNPTAEENL